MKKNVAYIGIFKICSPKSICEINKELYNNKL